MVDEGTHERLHGSGPVLGSDRTFGIVFAAFFGVVAILPWAHGRAPRTWAVPVAATFLVLAIVRPSLLRRLNWLWFQLGLLLQRVTSPVFLGLVFFGVLTPVALIRRSVGADPLCLKRASSAPTYWKARESGIVTPESLLRQF
jgi:hypothetical protein